MGRLPALDALRGLAALSVVVYHWAPFRMGWVGVPIFLALSGYLTTLRPPGDDYAWKRVTRLVPTALVSFFVVTAWYGAEFAMRAPLAFVDPARDTLPLAVVVWWSLSVEVVWYVLAPRFYALAAPTQRRVLWGVVVSSMAARLGLAWISPALAYSLAWWDCIAWGIVLARADTRDVHVAAAVVLLGAALLLGDDPQGPFVGWAAATLTVPLGAALLVSGLHDARAPWMLTWLGAISYPLYLLHPLALKLVHAADMGLASMMAASIAVAALAYHVLEEPMMRFAREWRPRIQWEHRPTRHPAPTVSRTHAAHGAGAPVPTSDAMTTRNTARGRIHG